MFVAGGGGSSRSMRRARVALDGPAPSLPHRGRAMQQNSEVYVGLDTSKLKISVALAEDGTRRRGPLPRRDRQHARGGRRLVRKLARRHGELLFCYEAGPTGYGLQRQIAALGHDCAVVAPSLIPKRPGERVKTNRRDALTLARLHRAGELTAIWVPDPGHEAMRELVRAREAAMEDLRAKRQHLQSFLLRHGRVFTGRQRLDPGAHALAVRTDLRASRPVSGAARIPAGDRGCRGAARAPDAASRRAGLLLVHGAGGRGLPGFARRRLLTAVTFVAEIGDVRRFDSPRQLMAYLGLVPSRELDRRAGAARRHHQGRQRPRSSGADRGRLDLSLPGADEPVAAGAAGGAAEGRAGDRLEGAGAAVWPLSAADGGRQAAERGHHRDRARDGGVPVGDRPRGRARARLPSANRTPGHRGGPNRLALTSVTAQRWRQGPGGEPSYELCGR